MGVRNVLRSRDERGVFIVLWALLLLALLTMVAIVVDLGQMRAVRRTNKSITDFASLAAGPRIAVSNPRGACKDALKNIRANALDTDLSGITQAEIDSTCGNPSAVPAGSGPGLVQLCPTPLPATSPSVSLVKGEYTVRIYHPVVDADIADPRLSGSAGLLDGTACQRIKVEIAQTAKPTFAKAIGVNQQRSTVSSVVRGVADPREVKVAALLVLERTSCQALWTSGQGNVLVKTAGPDDPGILHADSLGTSNCTTGGPSQRFVVYGTSVPLASGNPRAGQPSIQVEGVPTSPPTPCPGGGVDRGFLHLIFPFSGTAADEVDTGVCPGPTGGGITGRGFHDKRYNPPAGTPGRTKTINSLRSAAAGLLTSYPGWTLADTLRDKGYVVFPDDTATLTTAPATPAPPIAGGCGTNTAYTITNDKVFINCAPLNANNLTFAGTRFVTAGELRIGAGKSLRFPNATELIVQGSTPNGVDVNNGTFTVNDGSAAVCVSPSGGPDRTGTAVPPAHMVLMQGALSVTGSGSGNDSVIRMCQTFVYMADGTSPYSILTGDPSCATVPCPRSNSFTGSAKISAKTVDWSAPNQSAIDPASDGPPGPYEDLAFWSEAGGSGPPLNNDSTIGGNSTTATSGVFFLPNGLFTFTGNTGIDQEFNAQFVARRLNLNGQGALTMLPNPNDAVPTPFPSWRLIR